MTPPTELLAWGAEAGNHRRSTANQLSSKSPSQNEGIEYSTKETTVAPVVERLVPTDRLVHTDRHRDEQADHEGRDDEDDVVRDVVRAGSRRSR